MQRNGTILIVDDDAVGRETLKGLLMNEGYDLLFARDGKNALSVAVDILPDLVLLDVMMPEMDGFEVCRRMRSNPMLADLPIMMITALDDPDSILMGLDAGADDFLSKPYNRLALRSRVRTILRLNRYRRLHAQRSQFAWVVEESTEGYVVTDSNGCILSINPSARRFLCEDSAQTLEGVDFVKLARRRFQLEPSSAWQSWPTLTSVPREPLYLVRPESPSTSALWIKVTLMTLATGEHNIRLLDVTKELLDQQMIWSFQATIRHKLNTSLGIFLGYLQLIQELQTEFEPEISEMFDVAVNKAHQLRHDVQSVVHLIETLESGQLYDEGMLLGNLPALIQDLSQELDISDIALSQSANHDGGGADQLQKRLSISRWAMELILRELLMNAKKFHPLGNPNIKVCLESRTDKVRLQIQDDGVNLPSEELSKIWLPYYQAEKQFTGQIPGVGLGLHMVARLAQQVGGQATAFNRRDKAGMIFELQLPCSLHW